jgi:hypothetical protein
MMNELNYSTLRNALDRLPQHEPPTDLWADVYEALEAEAELDAATAQLKQYEPPTMVWQAIETALDQDKIAPAPPLLVQFNRRFIWGAAAAITLLVAYLATAPAPSSLENNPVMVLIPTVLPDTTTSYNTTTTAPLATIPTPRIQSTPRSTLPATNDIQMVEVVMNDSLNRMVETVDQDGPALIASLCQAQAEICEAPAFKALKSELDDLTAAEQSLREAIGPYSDDPELLAQLAAIERERSTILQLIIQLI